MTNPLGVTMGCRDFKMSRFWRDKITFIDRLEVTNYEFEEAHDIVKDYVASHSEYSHILIIAEDVLVTPDHINLLLKDYEITGYPVLCGYTNLGFIKDYVTITTKDLRGIAIRHTRQYGFSSVSDVVTRSLDPPLVKVFFQGLALALIKREVMEKVSFKPYIHWFTARHRRQFGNQYAKRGTMFDLKFSIDCADLEIPVYVDLRLLTFHFGLTIDLINAQGKTRSVTLIKKDGSNNLVRQDPPYF